MDLQTLLNDLLQSSKDLAEKGKDLAAAQLDIPPEGEARDAMLKGLGKGALAGGILALLLGTRGGRRLTGSAVKLGTLAALGTIGYQAYRKWQAGHGETVELGSPINELAGPAANERSLALIKAMIAAAKADGTMDAAEAKSIRQQMVDLGLDGDLSRILETEIAKPLDVQGVAQLADSPAAAVEMYLASTLVIDQANPSEKQYLTKLAAALGLPGDVVEVVDSETA